MELINAQLSALEDTIQSPIYSWVGPFKNFVSSGTWQDDCNSTKVMDLSFDEQMREFIKIPINSDCC